MLFFIVDFVDLLVQQTNIYASHHRSPWSDVTREEMYAFFALNIGMGIIGLPSINDYWSMEPLLQHPWFRTSCQEIGSSKFCDTFISLIILKH